MARRKTRRRTRSLRGLGLPAEKHDTLAVIQAKLASQGAEAGERKARANQCGPAFRLIADASQALGAAQAHQHSNAVVADVSAARNAVREAKTLFHNHCLAAYPVGGLRKRRNRR